MLHVYTRHLVKCAHSGDAHWRRCHCPKWIRGVLLSGTRIRRSTQSSNWKAAEKLARDLETEIDPEREKLEARRKFTLREAVETLRAVEKVFLPQMLGTTVAPKFGSLLILGAAAAPLSAGPALALLSRQRILATCWGSPVAG